LIARIFTENVSGEKTGKRLVEMIVCVVFYLNYANWRHETNTSL